MVFAKTTKRASLGGIGTSMLRVCASIADQGQIFIEGRWARFVEITAAFVIVRVQRIQPG